MLAAPAVPCARDGGRCAHEHTGTVGALRHSLRNGFTAYGALSLETNSSCLHRCRIDGRTNPVGLRSASVSLTPATGARTTRFCRTLQRHSSAAPPIAHRPKPALRSLQRSGRCRVHRIPCPTSVTIAIRPSWRAGNGRGCRADLGAGRRSLFFRRGLDGANHFDWVEENSRSRARPDHRPPQIPL